MAKRIAAIIVAGGSGRRMQSHLPKQFMMLGNMPVLARTINTMARALPGADIVVVLPEEHIGMWCNLAARFDVAPHRTVAGGRERFDSVRCGLAAVAPEAATIAVHDGVRALVSRKLIIRTLLDAVRSGASIPVVEPVDSCRIVDGGGSRIIPRASLRMVQTPQIFSAEILRRAYDRPYDEAFTDDASVVEASGVAVSLVEGERTNIKLTTPEDMAYAEYLISENDTDLPR